MPVDQSVRNVLLRNNEFPINLDTGWYVRAGTRRNISGVDWDNVGAKPAGFDPSVDDVDERAPRDFMADVGDEHYVDTINVTIDESWSPTTLYYLSGGPEDTVNINLPEGWYIQEWAKHGQDGTPGKQGFNGMDVYNASGVRVGRIDFAGGGNAITGAGHTAGAYYGGVNVRSGAVCFTRGTIIRTKRGDHAIEKLKIGDLIETKDHGFQPIRWIGSFKRYAVGNHAPIHISKGALGNKRDLCVSPQHRMLISNWQAKLHFGKNEVLATAKSLVNGDTIYRKEGGKVEYFHILFDNHEIIFAEDAPTESFHPGENGWSAMDEATRNEILELFPQLANGRFENYSAPAYRVLKAREAKMLMGKAVS